MLPDYWLLLAVVFASGFAAIILQSAASHPRSADYVFGWGMLTLGLMLVLQILLRFELQELPLRLFYWGRGMLAAAWLGHGYALLLQPAHPSLKKLTPALLLASLLALALVLFAQVTRAQDWYAPAQPIYGQLGDLLAANRPTRWLGLALNLYGLGALGLAGALAYRQGRLRGLLPVLAALAGVGLLVLGFYFPNDSLPRFYALEALPPLLLFLAWWHAPAQRRAK